MIDYGDKVPPNLHHQSTAREFVGAQAQLLVLGRDILPTEGLQVGAVHPLRAAMVWIKGAHAAPSPGSLAPFRITAVAPGVYVPNLSHRQRVMDLAVGLPGRNGDGAGDAVADLV